MAEIPLERLTKGSQDYKEAMSKVPTSKDSPKKEPIIKKEDLVSTKKSRGKKLLESFVYTDKEAIKDWIIWECLVPGIQDFGYDLLRMIFFHNYTDDRRGGRSSRRDYRGISNRGRSSMSRSSLRREDTSRRWEEDDDAVDYRNIILRDRRSAENLVDEIQDRIERTGSVSLSEFMEMIGEAEHSKYTDSKYGWTRTNQVGIQKVNGGWLIDIAEAKYIGDL